MSYNILSKGQSNMIRYKNHKIEDMIFCQRMRKISQEILNVNPAILLLQEADRESIGQLSYIANLLDLKCVAKLNCYQERNFGNLIGVNKDLFKIIGNYYLNFNMKKGQNYDQQNEFQREMQHGSNAVFSVILDRKLREKICLVNTHIVHSIEKGQNKLGSLVLILKTVLKLKEVYGFQHVLIGGDFNMIPQSVLYEFLVEGKLDTEVPLVCYSNQYLCMKQ